MTYHELQVTTHYSFLRGAASPDQVFETAAKLGLPALGIVDRNSVAGVVRALYACDEIAKEGVRIRSIPGCRLDLVDGASLLVWPEDRAGWGRLTRLLTLGKSRAERKAGEKGQCFLHWEDVAAHADGLVAALVPGFTGAEPVDLRWMANIFGSCGHVCLTQLRRPGDAARLHALDRAAAHHGLTPLATGDVLYDVPERRMLQDVVTAIREKCTIDELGFRRERSADRHLKSPQDMARRFRHLPHAITATAAIAERCTFSLRELDYQYPDEIVMSGRSPQQALDRLARAGLARKFDGDPPVAYTELLDHELGLVDHMGYAPYFLTVNSIMSYARTQDILCQGRGSAANSVICYALDITSIDPIERKLLFERFINKDRREPPDIDVDFEHERREDVIQWIYRTYGHDHAALTAVVSRFRSRGSIREVGKALGLAEDMTAGLASQIWGWSTEGVPDGYVKALNLDKSEPRLALAISLAGQLIGTPRHLSQHPGGFVLTRDRLHDLVPIEPAAMIDRSVIEWEKDDIEYLRFMKVDILGLGMLGCLRRCFDLLRDHKGRDLTMASDAFQGNDPATYAMIQRADTLGVFQIESRAQMSMLPRMKPKEFYDLVIQIAIVRPGPIQGDMVHPYLKRREQKESVSYPSPALQEVLEKTLGVPLFQEQAMQVAIKGAGFEPAEADQLRRAMATFKMTGGVGKFTEKLISGMLANGITQEFAERLVKQIEGFGSYGFPESHAASFAKIAYASCWMKHHHPDVFCAALLNAQPMGFYAPAQIVRDAREHGVAVLPPCINASEWDTVLVEANSIAFTAQADVMEPYIPSSSPAPAGGQLRCVYKGAMHAIATTFPTGPRHTPGRDNRAPRHALRLGLRIVSGLSGADVGRIAVARAAGPFVSVEDLWRRAKLSTLALDKLARADAFHALGLDRRQALWAVRGLGAKPLPLFAAAALREDGARASGIEPPVVLAALTAGREVVEDYRATQLSLRAHPLTFLRGELTRRRIRACGDLQHIRDGAAVEVAGIILVRQRPGSAKGVLFLTIEDETGIANGILWPDRFEAQRRTVMTATMVSIVGRVQKEGLVIHVVADRVVDLTGLLGQVGEVDLPRLTMPGDGATHGATIDPRDPDWKRGRIDWHYREKPIPVKSHDFH